MHLRSRELAQSFAAISANDTRTANDNFFDIISFGALDANSNRTKLSWPDGYYVGYCYDPLNRMSVAMANSTSSGCATNVLATYTYDPYSRRTNLAYGASASMAYSYTPAGDLTSLTDTQNSTPNSVAFTLGYTNAHQLASEAFSNSAFVQNGSIMGTTAYAPVNVLNQYTNVTPVSGSAITPSYDGNGNLTGDGTYTFAYDPENRLVSAAKSGLAAAYAYDPLGRREEKSGTGVTATVFLQDGSDEIAEYNTSGTLQRRFVPGPAIDDPIAMVPASGTTEVFYTDHHGSVIATSDASGNLVEGPFSYDAYGDCYLGSSQATPCTTVATGEPFKFTGQYFDAETGCYYYRARYYCADPVRGGRFLQTDPVGYKDDLNLYTYVGNDPTDRTDPTGLSVACTSTGSNIGGGSNDASGACGSTGSLKDIGSLRDDDSKKTASNDPPKTQDPLGPSGGTEHTTGARPSTEEDHQTGDARKKRDRGGEKGDKKRDWPRKRPNDWKGKWPPPPKASPYEAAPPCLVAGLGGGGCGSGGTYAVPLPNPNAPGGVPAMPLEPEPFFEPLPMPVRQQPHPANQPPEPSDPDDDGD